MSHNPYLTKLMMATTAPRRETVGAAAETETFGKVEGILLLTLLAVGAGTFYLYAKHPA